MGRHLEWREIYAFQKVFPLLTRWQLEQKSAHHISQSNRGFVEPALIKKKRSPRSVLSYEILWRDEHKYFSELFPDEQLDSYLLENDNNVDSLWTTIEPAELVDRVYPQLKVEFELAKLAKKKTSKTTKRPVKSPSSQNLGKKTKSKKVKPNDSLKDFSEMQKELNAIDINRKPTTKKPTALRSIDEFLRVHAKKPTETKDDSLLAAFPDSDIDVDNGTDFDLSELILGIVSRSPNIKRLHGYELEYRTTEATAVGLKTKQEEEPENKKNQSLDDIDLMIMKKKGPNPRHKRVKSLRMELLSSTPNRKSLLISELDQLPEKHESSFFDPATEQDDVFERSYNALIKTPADQDEDSEEIEMVSQC